MLVKKIILAIWILWLKKQSKLLHYFKLEQCKCIMIFYIKYISNELNNQIIITSYKYSIDRDKNNAVISNMSGFRKSSNLLKLQFVRFLAICQALGLGPFMLRHFKNEIQSLIYLIHHTHHVQHTVKI